ncbi:MAG: hypothetical protein R3D67_22115 [Hyphomicrobiaceae bacterium]
MAFDDLPPMARAAYSAALSKDSAKCPQLGLPDEGGLPPYGSPAAGGVSFPASFEDTEWPHYSASRPRCYPFRPSLDRIDNSGDYARTSDCSRQLRIPPW